jgi:hypothetical protein
MQSNAALIALLSSDILLYLIIIARIVDQNLHSSQNICIYSACSMSGLANKVHFYFSSAHGNVQNYGSVISDKSLLSIHCLT